MLEAILKTKEHTSVDALRALENMADLIQMADLAEIGMLEILESLHNRGDHNQSMLDLVMMMMYLRDYFLARSVEQKQAEQEEG